MRHGEAGNKLSSGSSDFDRPITVTGKREVTDITKSLKNFGVTFNFIITSPLKRAHQTASIMAMAFKRENNMENWDELKPEGNSRDFYRKLSKRFKQDSAILVVGHEPYLSSLISEIISDANTSSHLVLKEAGLAKIEITSQDVQTMHGELKWLLTPRLIKNISK